MNLSSPLVKTAVNAAVAEARDLPDLVTKLSVVSPTLAAQITGKALIASKSPWGTLLVAAVAWAASRWGLGWDLGTDTLVAGIGVLLGGFAMRKITGAPITGIFSAAAPPAPPTIDQTGAPVGELGKSTLVTDPKVTIPMPTGSVAARITTAAAALMLLIGVALPLSACDMIPTPAAVTAATTATISQAQADLQKGINLWGIAKGIGQVAALADPALQPFVTAASTSIDPVVAKAQVALNDAATDAAAIQALTAQITGQANALMLLGAPKITVVPNAPAVASAAVPG